MERMVLSFILILLACSCKINYENAKGYLDYSVMHHTSYVDALFDDSRGLSPITIEKIHSCGKEIIPYLINKIDINEYGLAGFVNPYDSNLKNVVVRCPMGINYAYMIELIMAKDSIISNSVQVNGLSSWEEKMEPYRIYGQCVIIRKEEINNPSDSKITLDDMKEIKSIYCDWWEDNKNEDIDSLRKKWKENGTPLKLSSFTWI